MPKTLVRLRRRLAAMLLATTAICLVTVDGADAAGQLVRLPSAEIELFAGPLTPAGAPGTAMVRDFDTLQTDQAAHYINELENYYDRALIFYSMYYRTGNTAYRDAARVIAADFRNYPVNYAPRDFSTLGLAIFALESGDAGARARVREQAESAEWAYLGYTEARETAYALIAMLAEWKLSGSLTSDLSVPAGTGVSSALTTPMKILPAHQVTTVSWSASWSTSPQDWVTLVPVGANYAGQPYTYTGGAANGTVNLTAPPDPGLYQVTYYLNGGFSVAAKGPVVRVVHRNDHGAAARVMLEYILAKQSADGRWEDAPGQLVSVPYTLNYMGGLLAESLILYDRMIGDSRIVPALKRWADWTYQTQWVPSAQAFRYATVDNGNVSTTPYANLNGLLLPAWGYLYAKTGDARYATQGDEIARGMIYVGGREIWGTKQFNQMFRSSNRYLGYLESATGSAPPPAPPAASNPTPTATSLSPSSVAAGSNGATVTVNGTNFLSSSVVRWNGAARPTTFVSATKLTAAITSGDLVAAGSAQVTVVNPAPGGGTSATLGFTITSPTPPVVSNPPVPVVPSPVTPPSTPPTTPPAPPATPPAPPSTPPTTPPATQMPPATPPAPPVTPPSPPATANPRTEAPTIRSVSAVGITKRGIMLAVHGNNFAPASVVKFNGAAHPTAFMSARRLAVTVSYAEAFAAGAAEVMVQNPGGATAVTTLRTNGIALPSRLKHALESRQGRE